MGDLGILGDILSRTRERVRERKAALPLDQLLGSGPAALTHRAFGHSISRVSINVIAEFKRRSPSKGTLRDDLAPDDLAVAYEAGGATALSILTDADFFGGSVEDLARARAATLLPVLRKDFVVDPYQVWEAASLGADAILLIVAALTDSELRSLSEAAAGAGLETLVEVHDREELDRALAVGSLIVGVNNRNLKTMVVDLQTSLDLVGAIPDHVIAVAESGITTGADVRRLREAGFDAFLVGEHLMRAPDPGLALRALLLDASKEE
ncbi:MAG TPA: indole-3-glycerol phosphate synthase TrpC [Vicinamibacteria bacterium]